MMTLPEVQRLLQEQEGELQAAYRALTEQTRNGPVPLPIEAIERLREACSVGPAPAAAARLTSGIRC